ncbi:MAG: hypothetical protein KDD50_07655 [Bdellovibrionales bacterium]|nr:hypothetical protein [Bdellovibrionales bacterium]
MKKSFCSGVLALLVFGFSLHCKAVSLEFQSIDPNDFEKISKDLGAYFSHTMISPASPRGDVFGIELGINAGVTATPGIDSMTKETDPNNSAEMLPHLNTVIGVSVPLGFTIEMNYLPSFSFDGVSAQMQSLGVKWTATKTVLDLPFDLAFRLFNSSAELSFSQTVSLANTNVTFKNSSTGLDVIGSKKFGIIEPYLQLGFAQLTSDLSTTGTSIIDPSLSASDSASANISGMRWAVGAQLDLYVLALGLEYAQFFGQTKTSAKLALTF